MTLRRQADSSSESSSGSSSDSSSSGSSSSSSGSGSSTSDTDSSASDSPKPQRERIPASVTVAAVSAASAPAASVAPPASATPAAPSVPSVPVARLPDSAAHSTSTPSLALPTRSIEPSENSKSRTEKSPVDVSRPGNGARRLSSSDDDVRISSVEPKPPPPRRRSSLLSKSKTTPANGSRQSRVPNGRSSVASKPLARVPPTKPAPTPVDDVVVVVEPKKPLKKKSIFSPDNSSESDGERKNDSQNKTKVPTKPSPASRSGQRGKRPKTSSDRPKSESENPSVPKKAPAPAPAPKKPLSTRKKSDSEKNKFRSKETVTSCGSSSDSTASASASGSDGDGEVVAETRTGPITPKRPPVVAAKLARSKSSKPEPVKTEKNTPKETPLPPCTDSDVENTKPANNTTNVTRKLTRSLTSARKSIHVIGKATNSDSDSDLEIGPSKRPISKSPVKRSSISTKGPPALCPVKGRGSGTGVTSGAIPRTGQTTTSPPEPEREELKCVLPGCDSLGHLSGRLDRHFTLEACPMYHNMTAEECREKALVVKSNQESRRRASKALESRRTSQPSLEHRAYQLKVKEMRAKWKSPSESQEKTDGTSKPSWSTQDPDKAPEREPILTGFVPDYDLNLFREAQAAAAYKIEDELKNMPIGKGTRYVCMGKYCMEAWYQSPYPPDAARLPQLYLCEFCLNHHKTVAGITRHKQKCVWRHPPGDEVYRKGNLGVWQVDGRKHKQYCQQLCLLAKFFLDHKTLYYDVEPFLFYVMTLADSEGCHTVGYFSKEKNSLQNYNVSCILTLPPYQRQGYGRLLIDFSYLLTRVEGKIGSPEKPLSDLGLISYRSYWKDVLLQYLCAHPGSTLSIKDLSQEMAINSYDIVSTLQALGMMKYWKGKHIILKKQDVLDEYMERVKKRGNIKQIDPTCLKWNPFVPPTSQGGG